MDVSSVLAEGRLYQGSRCVCRDTTMLNYSVAWLAECCMTVVALESHV